MGNGTKARVLKIPTLRLLQCSRSSLEFTADSQALNSRLPTQPVVAALLPSPFSDFGSQLWLAGEVVVVVMAFTIRARICTNSGLIRRNAHILRARARLGRQRSSHHPSLYTRPSISLLCMGALLSWWEDSSELISAPGVCFSR